MAGPPPQALPIPPQHLMGPGGPPGGPGGLGPGDGDPGGAQEDAAEGAALKAAAAALEKAFSVETDPQDKAMIAGLVQGVHKLLGQRDKEKQDAIGMSPALKLAQRQNR